MDSTRRPGEIYRMKLAFALLVALAVVASGCSGGGSSIVCHGLALADCRVTEGCVPDSCDLCTCTPTYRGCLATFEITPQCPAVDCSTPECCSVQAECTSGGASCARPGTPFGCGACNPDPGNCTDDAMCKGQGAAMICEPIACSCSSVQACVQGCVQDASCDADQSCDFATARCVPRACNAENPCSLDFDCTPGGCIRRSCRDDLECDGYCVEGACFSGRGECRLPSG